MNLDIVLRICGKHGVLGSDVERICGKNREEMLIKCFISLVKSVNYATREGINYHFYILDDNSTAKFKKKISKILKTCNKNYTFVPLAEEGFNYSAFEQFRYGKDVAQDLVYFVEDDYLHTEDAISSMTDAFFYFSSVSDLNEVCIYPYDSTHNYAPDTFPQPTRLFYDSNRLWRTTRKTANTMFLHSNTVRRYFPLFEKLAKEYKFEGTVFEDNTINRMYSNTVTIGGPVWLFSPIPSLAAHLSFAEPIQLKTEMNDWKKEYDSIDITNYKT